MMERRARLERRTPLRSDPVAQRDWERRSRRRLPAMSPRRRHAARERAAFVAMVLRHRPVCEARFAWCCTGRSAEVNEIVRGPGREDCWLDWDRVSALCGPCHRWITDHGPWAIRHGHQVPHEDAGREAALATAMLLRAMLLRADCPPDCATDHREENP
jgi:hypothetical protein